MKLFLLAVIAVFASTEARVCWECIDAPSNAACIANGDSKQCQSNEQSCETHFRYHLRNGRLEQLVTKICKATDACLNNEKNNPADCDDEEIVPRPDFVCRCCCHTDLCGQVTDERCRPLVQTTPEAEITTTPTPGCPDPEEPRNGKTVCLDEPLQVDPNLYEPGAVCNYECDPGYVLVTGPEQTICRAIEGGEENVYLFRPLPPCCAPECQTPIDLAIVLDSSSSINAEEWATQIEFTRDLVRTFTLTGPVRTHVSVVRYNNEPRDPIYFNDWAGNPQGLLRAIRDLERTGSGTFTGTALRFARRELLNVANGDRPDVANVVLLLTDGASSARDPYNPARQAELLRTEDNAIIFAIGIGVGGTAAEAQIRAISGDENYIPQENFEGLTESLANSLGSVLCDPDYCDRR